MLGDRVPPSNCPVASPAEASEFLVGSSVFKTDGGSTDPRRVRFPSASAIQLMDFPRFPGLFRSGDHATAATRSKLTHYRRTTQGIDRWNGVSSPAFGRHGRPPLYWEARLSSSNLPPEQHKGTSRRSEL